MMFLLGAGASTYAGIPRIGNVYIFSLGCKAKCHVMII